MVKSTRSGAETPLTLLSQESVGDHSQVTRAEFEAALAFGTMQAPLVLSELPGTTCEEDATVRALKTCGVLAILRAKNTDAAIERGLELISLGCKAIEVTLDTADWRRVLKTLAVPPSPSTFFSRFFVFCFFVLSCP